MIEKKIEDLIDAIEANTAALLTLAAAPIAAAKPTPLATASGGNPKTATEVKPAAVKTKKPAKTEEQVVAEAAAQASEDDVTLEQLAAAVGALLKANKRAETIALLASFEGAKAASGIFAQGQEVAADFLAQAEGLLLSA